MAMVAAAALALGLAGCTGGAGPNEPAPSGAPTEASPGASASRTPRGADLATARFAVSWTEAIATAKGGFDGEPTEIELDWTRDRYAYTVELISDTEEYEVRIDADTGESFDARTEPIESDELAEKRTRVIDLDAVVPWDRALETALAARGGPVDEWKLEGTAHGPRYQFDIGTDAGGDAEVTVDALTGELVAVDD